MSFRRYGGVVSIFGRRGCGGQPLLRLEVRDMFLRFFSRLEVFSYPRTFVPPYPRNRIMRKFSLNCA